MYFKMDYYASEESLRRPLKPAYSTTDLSHTPLIDTNSIRSILEKEYEEKLRFAREKYEERIEALTSQTKQFYDTVKSDDLVNAMRGNEVSGAFVQQRVKELYEDTMLKEKEVTIERLHNQLIEQWGEIVRKDQENSKLLGSFRQLEETVRVEQDKRQQLEREYITLKHLLEQNRAEAEDLVQARLHIKRLQDSISDGENNLRAAGREIEHLRQEIMNERNKFYKQEGEKNALIKEMEQLRDVANNWHRLEQGNFEYKRQIAKLSEELDRLRNEYSRASEQRDELSAKCSTYNQKFSQVIQAEQKANVQAAEQLQLKFKKKSKQFKKKIIEQRSTIETLDNQLKASKLAIEELKKANEKRAGLMQEDLKRVRDEWERKCNEIQLESKRKEAEIMSKYQLQISSMQGQFQSLMDQRVSEIQAEMSTQISKSRMYDTDIKSIMEDKIRELEKDYIPNYKHESIIREKEFRFKEEYERLEQKYNEQVRSLQRECALLREEASSKNTELNTNIDRLTSQLTELQKAHALEQQNNVLLQEKVKRMSGQVEEYEKSKRILVEHLDTASENLGKLKAACEEEYNRRLSAESEVHSLRENLSAMRESVAEHKEILFKSQKAFEDRLRSTSTETEEILVQERARNSQIMADLAHTQKVVDTLEKEKKELRHLLEKTEYKVNEQLTFRQKENEKLDSERNKLAEAVSQLNSSDRKIQALTQELKETHEVLDELRAKYREAENELAKTTDRLYEYDSALNHGHDEKRDLIKKAEKLKIINSQIKERTKQFVKNRCYKLQNELHTSRISIESEINLMRKETQSIIQDLLFRFLDTINHTKRKYDEKMRIAMEENNRDWTKRMQDLEDELQRRYSHTATSYSDRFSTQEKQLSDLKQSLNSLKREQRQLIEELERSQNKKEEIEEQLNSYKLENKKLQDQLEKNSLAFDSLQKEVAAEAARIKQESASSVNKAKQELRKKHQSELKDLLNKIDETEKRGEEELRKLERQIIHLQDAHGEELTNFKRKYQTFIQKVSSENEGEAEKCARLRAHVVELQDHIDRLQAQYNTNIKQLEDQLAELERHSKIEEEKFMQTKLQKTNENEKLSKHVRQLTKDVKDSRDQLNNAMKERERLKLRLSEMEGELDSREKEFSHLLNTKEAEISALKSLLNKSYTESLDNVKRARDLNRETQELKMQIKRPVSSRGFAVAYPNIAERLNPE